jgi:hypothetical protein
MDRDLRKENAESETQERISVLEKKVAKLEEHLNNKLFSEYK